MMGKGASCSKMRGMTLLLLVVDGLATVLMPLSHKWSAY